MAQGRQAVHRLIPCLIPVPTDNEIPAALANLPVLPEYAQPFFDLFVSSLNAAANGQDSPITLHPDPDDPAEMTLDWDETNPEMAFMRLFSNQALSLFITETLVLGLKNQDDYSLELTKEDDE